MLRMPSGDISEIKYLLPIVDNAIEGYYNIEKISFGTYKKKIGDTQIDMPTLRIKIGKYHLLDTRLTEGVVPHMANQVWSRQTLNRYIQKTQTYLSDSGIYTDIAQEPEAVYGYTEPQSDYIESV